MKNGAKTPGLSMLATSVVAFVICLAGFAHGTVTVGVAAAIVALLSVGAGFAWRVGWIRYAHPCLSSRPLIVDDGVVKQLAGNPGG